MNHHKTQVPGAHVRKPTRGQGLVEFALVLPLLVLIIFGVLDLGRAFYSLIAITNAAREGARYGAYHADDMAVGWTGVVAAVRREAAGSGIDLSSSPINVACPDFNVDWWCDRGEPITVSVSYDFDLLLGWLLPSPIQITRDAKMMVP